jgi:hypothetical protein
MGRKASKVEGEFGPCWRLISLAFFVEGGGATCTQRKHQHWETLNILWK